MTSQSTDELREKLLQLRRPGQTEMTYGTTLAVYTDDLVKLITSYTDKKVREARKNATRLRLEREIFRLRPGLSMQQIHETALDIENYWIESCLPDVLEAQLNGSEK